MSASDPSQVDPAKVKVRRAEPAVWTRALKLAEGDPRRLDILEDGSVIVRNARLR